MVFTALSDRRGITTRELYAFDPWTHRWLTLTRRLMLHYRARGRIE